MKIKTIIIDDEDLARALVRSFLKAFEHIEILAEASDGFQGLKLIQEHKPDLIFLDIQMPKITGLEMLELVENPPHVIFSTAYDQYALQAFEKNAIDYLLKPYSKERFQKAVEKAVSQISSTSSPSLNIQEIKSELLEEKTLDKIVVKNANKIEVISLPEIYMVEAYGDYIWIHTLNQKYLKQQTMKSIEKQLGSGFMRVHRGYIVNLDYIDKLELFGNQSYLLILKNKLKVDISKAGYKELKERLGW
jgi:two-component system, LytTR family, response regulator